MKYVVKWFGIVDIYNIIALRDTITYGEMVEKRERRIPGGVSKGYSFIGRFFSNSLSFFLRILYQAVEIMDWSQKKAKERKKEIKHIKKGFS